MEHTFDTLAFAERLQAGGFTRPQAEILAKEQAKLIDERLATKLDIGDVRADVEKLRLEVKRDIEASRAETKKIVAETKVEIIKWVVGLAFAQMALFLGALKIH